MRCRPCITARATSISDFPERCRSAPLRLWRCCAIWERALPPLDSRSSCSTTPMAGTARLIDVMARDLRAEFGLRLLRFRGPREPSSKASATQERAYGFHAGEVETAFLLASVPELVDRSAYTSELHRRCGKPEAAASGKCPGHFRLAHARYCAERRDGRSAAGHSGKRGAVAGSSRNAARGCARSDDQLPEMRPHHEPRRLG